MKAAEDLRSRATASQDLLRTMLGITRPIVVETPVEPTPEPTEELTVEEVVAAIGKDITPEPAPPSTEGSPAPPETPEPVVEGDQAEA